jgi:hypothetical protein
LCRFLADDVEKIVDETACALTALLADTTDRFVLSQLALRPIAKLDALVRSPIRIKDPSVRLLAIFAMESWLSKLDRYSATLAKVQMPRLGICL